MRPSIGANSLINIREMKRSALTSDKATVSVEGDIPNVGGEGGELDTEVAAPPSQEGAGGIIPSSTVDPLVETENEVPVSTLATWDKA